MKNQAFRVTLISCLIAALCVCSGGIYADSRVEIRGADVVEPDAGGGDLLTPNKGEDLLFGLPTNDYPWPTSPTALTVVSPSVSDTGYVVLTGLISAGQAKIDSVQILGAGVFTVTGRWWRVNIAEYHSTRANVGALHVYGGEGLLQIIPPYQSRSSAGVFSTSNDQEFVTPEYLRVTTSLVTAGAPSDSSYAGVVAIIGRPYGQPWRVLDQMAFSSRDPSPEPLFYSPKEQWNLGPRADYVVSAASTGAATFIDARFAGNTEAR